MDRSKRICVSKGCFLEVDLEYPKELSELHNNYPLASDKIEIKKETLSKYQLNIADFSNIPIGTVKKLLLNFFSKEKYVLHFQKLQLYLKLELKFRKIHRVLEFNQSQELKPYVELNTQNRVEAKKMVTKMENCCTT